MRGILLSMAFTAVIAAQTAPPESLATISGVVTDTAGVPLAGLTVIAAPGRGKAVTDAQGRYTISGLKPGAYMLAAGARMAGKGMDITKSVTLAAGQELKADLQVELFGEINGKVVDENKEPVPDIMVMLGVREYVMGAVRYRFGGFGGQTDDRGVYRIKTVQPGKALVVLVGRQIRKLPAVSDAPAKPELRKRVIMRTYYPDAPTFDGAEAVVLRPGEKREGVDIKVRKTASYCMDGVLQAAGKPAPMNFDLTEPGPASGINGGGGGTYVVSPNGKTGADGKFRICDLSPGTYSLRASADSAGSGVPPFMGKAEVTIKDEDVHDVRLSALPLLTMAGEVVWDGPAPEKPVDLKVDFMARPVHRAPWRGEGGDAMQSVPVPGEFKLRDLFVDDYSLGYMRLQGAAEGVYIEDVTYGTASVRYEPLRAGSVPGGTLRIVIGRDGGTVTAKVSDKDGNPVPDIRVYIVPASVASEALVLDVTATGTTNQAGIFTSPVLAPGKYHVLASTTRIDATPELVGKLWRSRLRGTEVELGKNGAAQVSVRPVSIE